MRIAHVVRQYHPSVGGMEDVVHHLARHQLEAGHAPRIVTLDRLFRDRRTRLAPHDELDGIPVRRLGFAGSTRYPLCPQVLAALGEADLVHVHGIDFFFDYLAATRWLHRRTLVASTHGGFFHTRFAARLKEAFFRTVTRRSVQAYARIIATSASDGRTFAPIAGPERLLVIENGVNVRKFRDRAARTLTPTLIYFGRWSANKGLPATIALAARLRRRDPAWRLIVAGREYDTDRAALAELVAAEGLGDAVTLVPDPDDAELAALIGQASYFVCLSRHEGFGLAAVEAMSAGLIPLLSDIPPFRSLVDRSGLGVLMTDGEPDAAVTDLLELHRRAPAAHPVRRARAMAFAAPYDWSQVAGRYLDAYRGLEALP
jgi:alpha-1,3-mannosyltransferase